MSTRKSVIYLNPSFTNIFKTNQGTGKLGLEQYKTETLVDTTKMTPDEKKEYLKNFNKGN